MYMSTMRDPVLPLKVFAGAFTDGEVKLSVIIPAIKTTDLRFATLYGYRTAKNTIRLGALHREEINITIAYMIIKLRDD